MPRILTRALVVAATTGAALIPAAGAASAHPDVDTCDGIANCADIPVTVGDINVSVLDQIHLLHAHH